MPTQSENPPQSSPRTLAVTSNDRRALRLPWSALALNKAHEFWVKGTGRRIKGQGMIGADAKIVAEGFGALRGADFDEYNLPQVWVERRQIPQAVHGRVPMRDAVVLDLGCGPGTSTEVLAYFADPSWTIIGYDLVEHSIKAARERAARGGFRSRAGTVIHPLFECQNIAQPLLLRGQPLKEGTVDFVISGGVVGLYLRPADVEKLIRDLRRIVKPGGYVALDSGPSVPPETLRAIARENGLAFRTIAKSFWIEPRPKLVFQREADTGV